MVHLMKKRQCVIHNKSYEQSKMLNIGGREYFPCCVDHFKERKNKVVKKHSWVPRESTTKKTYDRNVTVGIESILNRLEDRKLEDDY